MLTLPTFGSEAADILLEREIDFGRRPLTEAALLEILQVSSLNGINLSGADLSGGHFSGTSFEGANLTGVNFQDANLEGANLSKASIGSASFRKARMSGARLDRSAVVRKEHWAQTGTVYGPVFKRADLSNASLRSAVLHGSIFINTKLHNADFRSARLQESVFRNVDLTSVRLSNTVLGSSKAENCTYTSEGLTPGQRLGLAQFAEGTEPRSAQALLDFLGLESFVGADLRGCSFAFLDFSGYDFSNANLEDTTFHMVRAYKSVFAGANLKHAALEGSDFSQANFRGANLSYTGVPIRGCLVPPDSTFTGADLRDANLTNASFHCENPQKANFLGAIDRGLRLDTSPHWDVLTGFVPY